jgi:hypothetical protein
MADINMAQPVEDVEALECLDMDYAEPQILRAEGLEAFISRPELYFAEELERMENRPPYKLGKDDCGICGEPHSAPDHHPVLLRGRSVFGPSCVRIIVYKEMAFRPQYVPYL